MNKKNKINDFEIERFTTDINQGLNLNQVTLRKDQKLINTLNTKYSKSYFNIFYNNICTFFNLLGLIVFVALLATNSKLSDYFFVVIFLSNIFIGIFQEIRAKYCIDKLKLVSNKSVKVIRNGERVEISPEEIVLDDVIVLEMGAQIPTDCKILEGEVEVNESLLTGESDAIKKVNGCLLLAGSFIVSGSCIAVAERVGCDNYIQQLSAKAKQYKKPHSELMDSLKFFIKVIGIIIVPIAILFMLKSTLISKVSIPLAIKRTSTVVIGMIPSGMMLLTSVALAVGIIKLASHRTLVQDLYSLEMLARVDTICFDKTGTITDGKMTVTSTETLDNNFNFDVKDIVGSMLNVLKDNNQTAIALYNYFGNNSKYKSISSIPFSSKRKLSAVTFENVGTFSFGAPEFILTNEEYLKIKDKVDQYAQKGFRVLLLAKSTSPLREQEIPNDFTPVCLIVLADHIRDDAFDTVKWFKENGVAVKVISGDNPITVSQVSKRVGIENAEQYISLEGLNDQEVYDCANKFTVFGRVSPEQKAILVKAMKDAGHVTAMTGDGVNDILALKEADCAITVASGSEATRNISHIVLMDNNFASMPKVVYEGRRVINNVQSSASLYLMKTFFTMVMSLITMCYLDTYPFVLSQMILLEVFVIGVPSFFLSLQANDNKVEGKFISHVVSNSVPGAILIILSVLLVEIFRMSLNMFSQEIYTTMSVYAITLSGVINLFIICRPLNNFRAILFGIDFLVVFSILAFALFNGLPIFSLTALTPISTYWHHILIMVLIVLIDLPLALLMQKIFNSKKLRNKINKI